MELKDESPEMKIAASRLEKVLVGVLTTLAVTAILGVSNWVAWATTTLANSEHHIDSYTKLADEVTIIDAKTTDIQSDVAIIKYSMQKREKDIDEIKLILRSAQK